jgi:hypothetical protein
MPSVPITKIPSGMRHWAVWAPTLGTDTVEIWREGWPDTYVVSMDAIHPTMNIYGLYWRKPQEKAVEVTHAIN